MAERLPRTVMSGKVRMPAIPLAACSRWRPTNRPSIRAIPNCSNMGSMIESVARR